VFVVLSHAGRRVRHFGELATKIGPAHFGKGKHKGNERAIAIPTGSKQGHYVTPTNEAKALEEAASRAGETPSEWARDLLLHGVVSGSRKLPSRAYGCSRAAVTHSHMGTIYSKYCAIVNTSKICHGRTLRSNSSISMTHTIFL
jgi:hypothetical protein